MEQVNQIKSDTYNLPNATSRAQTNGSNLKQTAPNFTTENYTKIKSELSSWELDPTIHDSPNVSQKSY